MKNFTKVCLILSLFLIVIGGTLCGIGAVTGGWRQARNVGERNSWIRFAWKIPKNYGWKYFDDLDDLEELEELEDYDDWDDIVEMYMGKGTSGYTTDTGAVAHHESGHDSAQTAQTTQAAQRNASQDYENTGIKAAEVKNLDIEIGGAVLYLLEAEDDCFGIRTEGKEKYRSYEKSGTFYLQGYPNSWKEYSEDNKVYLYLPKNMTFHEADIEVGGGRMEAVRLAADEINLTVGAGQIIADELTCIDLSAEAGAGEIVLNQITAQKLDVETGLGNAYLQGSVSRNIDIECGMGNVELVLSGDETDFNYDIECAAGNVTVGSRSYSALADDTYINNRAAGKCSLECAMGEISITFAAP